MKTNGTAWDTISSKANRWVDLLSTCAISHNPGLDDIMLLLVNPGQFPKKEL